MRKLRLSTESLADLATDELLAIAGGTHLGCGATDACTHATTCPVSTALACYTVDPVVCFGLTTPPGCLTNSCACD
jgi:hypothetical protein